MERYNNKLCMTYDDLQGIVSYDNLKKMVARGRVERVRRPSSEQPALIAVDSLPYKYQTEVYRRFPDAKARAESKPFIECIEPDGAAMNFYETYQLPDGRYLTPEKIEEYSNNAAVLNAFKARLERARSQWSKASKSNRVKKSEYWRLAAQALPRIGDKYPNTLPSNPRRLQDKFNQYLREGYVSLITGKYGKRNAAKVMTEEQENVIIKLLADYRNLNDEQIVGLYNYMGKQLEWKEVTVRAVQTRREKYNLITSAGRLGASNFHNVKAMQNKREKPNAPLLFWTLDGWDVELYYQAATENDKGHNVTTYTNRLCMVVVLDPCEMYPVGYAIGTHETPELITAALRNAANHTAELFGTRYRTNQLQSDHYAIKKMSPLYGVMSGKYTPARVKNAKSKIIEPYFGYLNTAYFQYLPNWSGFGITSDKNKQPNSDALSAHKHSFPDIEGCITQISNIMELERAKKREAYLAQWSELLESQKLPLTDEQYLLHFGEETGRRNAIEGQGLRPTINGVKRTYDCFDMRFREYQHVRWGIKYDPDNLDRVLAISEDGSLRFMLEEKYVQPMALANRKEGDAEQLARVNQFNAGLKEKVINRLAVASDSCRQLMADNPALDNSLAKAIISDSNGQHKDQRNRKRLQANEIKKIACKVVSSTTCIAEPPEDNDPENLW